MSHWHTLSLKQLSQALHSKAVSATELAQHFLGRAKADTSGAFLALDDAATLAQAKAAVQTLPAHELRDMLADLADYVVERIS